MEQNACDWCWERREVRVTMTTCSLVEPALVCEACWSNQDSELGFSELQSSQNYFLELDDLQVDFEIDRRRDDKEVP